MVESSSFPLWRIRGILTVIFLSMTGLCYSLNGVLPSGVLSGLGFCAFLSFVFLCSKDIRRVNFRVVGMGLAMQVALAILITQVGFVRDGFNWGGGIVNKVVLYSQTAAGFLFGPLADPVAMKEKFGSPAIPFAITVFTTVIFVGAAFSVLYHLRIAQAVIWVLAKLMVVLMGKNGVSGAESLSAASNIFIGQTEAPLVIKPYIAGMTQSELLAVMIGGMATVAGGVMAIYIGMVGPEYASAILATSVMAAPCGLYIAKILIPETGHPETRGQVSFTSPKPNPQTDGTAEPRPSNVVDAAASGASAGMYLALNIIAMLIAFQALIAVVNALFGLIDDGLSLQLIFSWVFHPLSILMGVDAADAGRVAELLGIKLVGNEFLAFDAMTKNYLPGTENGLSPRSFLLASFALTGFANISSIGIQIGGIGALVPSRRAELARLGGVALLGGFLATLMNACIAGIFR